MKTFFAVLLAVGLLAGASAEIIQTTAALPNDTLIWPLPKLDVPDMVTVRADFKEQKELCAYAQGNWQRSIFLVTYTVSSTNTGYPYPELKFIAEEAGPSAGSGIRQKKLQWPFKKGSLVFHLEKDRECRY